MKTNDFELMIRTTRPEDADSVQQIVSACDIDEFGTDEFVINMTEVFEKIPFETNSWVACTGDNRIVGHAFMEEMGPGRIDTYVFTHPGYKNLGIGTLLVEQTEKRAMEYIKSCSEKNVHFQFNNIIPAENTAAKEILEGRGYKFKRLDSIMCIKLGSKPERVVTPQNISIRNFDPSRDSRELYEVYVESFRDARNHRPKPFEEWMKDKLSDCCDFSLWYLAFDDEKMAGFLIGKEEGTSVWIDLLGVKRDERRHGIGRALLMSIIEESYKRGINTVALSVDSDSPTSAQRLYSSIGMKPVFQVIMYGRDML